MTSKVNNVVINKVPLRITLGRDMSVKQVLAELRKKSATTYTGAIVYVPAMRTVSSGKTSEQEYGIYQDGNGGWLLSHVRWRGSSYRAGHHLRTGESLHVFPEVYASRNAVLIALGDALKPHCNTPE